MKGKVSISIQTPTNDHHSCFYFRVTHPAVTPHQEVGRAAGENMRIVYHRGGSKLEFSLRLWKMLKKESITLLQAQSHREASETEEQGKGTKT